MTDNCLRDVIAIFCKVQDTQANHPKNAVLLKRLYEKHDFKIFVDSLKKAIYDTILNTEHLKPSHQYVNRIVLFFGTFCKLFNTSNEKNKENKNPIKLKPQDNDMNDEHEKDETQDEEDELEDPLLTNVAVFLLEASQSKFDMMRYRSCQLINVMLDSLTGMYFSGELSDNLKEYMLLRLQDSKMLIRLHAILALNRIQDIADPEDEIVHEFITLMKHDTSAKVRKLCVEKVVLRLDVLEAILERVTDVDDNVKMAAMQKLAMHSKSLLLSQIRKIVVTALSGSPKVIQFFTSTILPVWLTSHENDILALMKRSRFGNYEADFDKDIYNMMYINRKILYSFYFKVSTQETIRNAIPLKADHLMAFEDLNWESVSYLRILAEYVKENDMDDVFEQILPDAVVFCRYIQEYALETTGDNFIEKQFIIGQFFHITKLFDYSDPAIRTCFVKLIVFILQKIDLMEEITEVIVSNLELIYRNFEQRSNFICEIIAEIFCPSDADDAVEKHNEKEFQLSKLKVKMNVLMDEKEQAIKNEEFLEAEKIKNEIEMVQHELKVLGEKEPDEVRRKMDVSTVTKCLDIASAALKFATSSNMPVSMKTFQKEIVQDENLIASESVHIKNKAWKFYSMCSVLDKPTALIGIQLFSVPIVKYDEDTEIDSEILIVCIKAVVDLLRVYGTNLITEPYPIEDEANDVFTGGISLSKLVKGLVALVEDSQYDVRETAVVGLCKLILSERIRSSPLIVRLVLKWLNPDSDEPQDNFLKQLIGHFLQQVPYLPSSLELLEDVVIETVTALFKASQRRNSADVDIDNTAKFLLALCKVSRYGPEINSNIARSVCKRIGEKPRARINAQYSKLLLMLDPPENPASTQEVEGLCDQILEAVSDRTTLNNVTKFRAKLAEKCFVKSEISTIAETIVEEETLENDTCIEITLILLIVLITAYIFIGYKFLLDFSLLEKQNNNTGSPTFSIPESNPRI